MKDPSIIPTNVTETNWAFCASVEKPVLSVAPRTVAATYTSKPSKNMPMPMSIKMRRWNTDRGRRSRRAPAFTVKTGSLFFVEHGQAAFGERFDGKSAILVEGVLLRREEKLLAAPRSIGVETQNARDECIRFANQFLGRADLRDKPDLERVLWTDGFTEQYQRKGGPWQCIFAKVGHDGRRSEAGTHLGERQRGVFRNQHEVAYDREAETEAKGVTLHFGHADQWRSA